MEGKGEGERKDEDLFHTPKGAMRRIGREEENSGRKRSVSIGVLDMWKRKREKAEEEASLRWSKRSSLTKRSPPEKKGEENTGGEEKGTITENALKMILEKLEIMEKERKEEARKMEERSKEQEKRWDRREEELKRRLSEMEEAIKGLRKEGKEEKDKWKKEVVEEVLEKMKETKDGEEKVKEDEMREVK